MTELIDIASRIVANAEGDEQVEAFLTHQKEFVVKAYAGEVESLSSAEPRGAGIRVIRDQRVGFAFTTDLSERGLDEALSLARQNARHATPDETTALAERTASASEVAGLYDEAQSSVAPERKVDFAIELDKAARSGHELVRGVEESEYADSDTEVAIATSTGITGSYRRSDAWCYTVPLLTKDGQTEAGFDFDVGRGLASLDPERVARSAIERGLNLLGATKIPSQKMPVVFDPYVAGQFLGVIGTALVAEAVQKGRSLFAGKLGESVAGESLTLVDDGRMADAPGAAPWDGEGVTTQRTEVISGGVLKTFLYDTKTAKKDGTTSTGNAARAGFKSVPSPSPSNMFLLDTGESVAEVLRRADRAFLVQDLHGVHSGANPISGDFSVGATGVLLEEGEPGQGVKEVTIAAPMLEILTGIVAVADDRRWLPFGGSFGGATTLVAEMTVAGE